MKALGATASDVEGSSWAMGGGFQLKDALLPLCAEAGCPIAF